MSTKISNSKILTSSRILMLMFFMVMSFWTVSSRALENNKSPSDQGTTEPQKWALLIGINDYGSIQANLSGCVADIEAMHEILIHNFKFPESNIKTLLDREATTQNIKQAFTEHLLKNSKIKQDDIILVYYSGHGTQVPDEDNDEPDGFDEAIVPQDVLVTRTVITDDEIGAWLYKLKNKTKNLAIVFDSCHSGSATRDPYSAVRYLPLQEDTRGLRSTNTPTTDGERSSDWMITEVGYAFISGCRHFESSHEFEPEPGKIRGVLSYHLEKVIKGMESPLTYRELIDNARGAIEGTRYKNRQHPVLEGDLDKQVFSGITVPRRSFYSITNINGEYVTVNAGSVHLLSSGSILAVYPVNVTQPEKEKNCIAKLLVESVSSTSSRCRIITEADSIPMCQNSESLSSNQNYNVAILQHNFGELSVSVTTEKVINPTLRQRIEKIMEDQPYVKLTDIQNAELIFSSKGDSIYGPLVDLLCLKSIDPESNDYQSEIETELLRIAQRKNLSKLNNPHSVFKLNTELLKIKVDENDNIIEKVVIDAANLDYLSLAVGDLFKIRVTNNSPIPIWVSVLDLQTGGGIGVIYPLPGSQDNEILPDKSIEIPRWGYYQVEEPVGVEKLKVIGTSKQTSFKSVEMPGCTSSEFRTRSSGIKVPGSPLEALFAHPLVGKRASYKPMSIDDWVVKTVRFEVVK